MDQKGGRGVVEMIFKGQDESLVTDRVIVTVSFHASKSWPVNHLSFSHSWNQVNEGRGGEEGVALSLLQKKNGPEGQAEATLPTPACFEGAVPSPGMLCTLAVCINNLTLQFK